MAAIAIAALLSDATVSAFELPRFFTCVAGAFGRPPYEESVRKQVLASAKTYSKAHKGGASSLRGTEAGVLKTLNLPRDGAVISLGSGPDIFRPVYDFPNASAYHLFDALSFWGSGPGEILQNLLGRVQALSHGRFQIVDRGFIDQVSPDLMENGAKFFENLKTEGSNLTPLKIRAEIPPKSGSWKIIYVHPLDFENTEQVRTALRRCSPDKIQGILLTGTGTPPDSTLRQLWSDVESGGVFIHEMRFGHDMRPHGMRELPRIDRRPNREDITIPKIIGTFPRSTVVVGPAYGNASTRAASPQPGAEVPVIFQKQPSKNVFVVPALGSLGPIDPGH